LLALRIREPLELSIFPSLLLVLTLFRLSLNVATTRLILLHGGEGAGAVGHVVEAFGRFAVGGSVLIGAVVFAILMLVNFIVITKGSGRVSEVAARFTLDAMPGKQMAIDADLAAGLIDEATARARRRRLEQETEFFGAMDGASKFVRGDAIAGLAVTGINIVGGLIAGIVRDGSTIAKAMETYTILTIGDGLVSQLPALLLSTAAGMVVTRAGTSGDLGQAFSGQLTRHPTVLMTASAVLVLVALVPGMPTLVLLTLAGLLFLAARRAQLKQDTEKRVARGEAPAPAAGKPVGEEKPGDLLHLDALELELGVGLVALIDPRVHGELPGRVTVLRKQLATDLGVLLPSVHLKDNLRLEADTYRVLVRGVEVARGTAKRDHLLVLDPGGGEPNIEGIATREPAFGLPARWVGPEVRGRAEARGYTVVEPAAAIATHIAEVLKKAVPELLGRQEMQELLSLCAKEAPKLVEDTIPGQLGLGELVQVCRGLLREGVSIRDLRSILEAIADAAPRSKEIGFLVEQVRRRLNRHITRAAVDERGVVCAITLDLRTEQMLRGALGVADGDVVVALDVENARGLLDRIQREASKLAVRGLPTVVLAAPDLRRPLYDFASRFVPDLTVVCARELVPGTPLEPVGSV
jgi:flagellar biosynthesis protein FlhA